MSEQPPHPMQQLVETVPEFGPEYPYAITLVMDAFADFVRDGVRDGAPEELLDRCFAFVESLAATDSQRLHNLVIVCFIEAASWGELGAKDRFGPATRRLILEADPRMIDPELLA